MAALIPFTICSLFFPIWIQFSGKDALTTGTVVIIFAFFLFFLYFVTTKKREFKFLFIVLALIAVATISTLSVSHALMGPSLRRYLQLVGALVCFLLIVNYYKDIPPYERLVKLEFLLSMIIFLFIVQIIIGIALYFFPEVGQYFSLFTTRDRAILTTNIADGTKRLTSIIVAQETFGEILALLMPLVLYKLIKKGGAYYIAYGIFTIGVILTATRSSILLFILGTFIFFVIHSKMINPHIWFVCISSLTSSLVIYFIYIPNALNQIIMRFEIFLEVFKETGSVVAAIDRDRVWDIGVTKVVDSLNLFGNGLITIINNEEFHLHNIFLTILHQLGIVGFLFFFGLMGWILLTLILSIKQVKDKYDSCLLNSILMAFIIFLLSEMKCEFNRGSSYQQVIWILLGIFHLISQTLRDKSQIETSED